MTCSPHLIEAFLDEEIDAARRAAVEQHMAACPDCAALYQRLYEQRAAIRADAPYYNAPPELGRSVRAALRRAAAQNTAVESAAPWRWLAIAASLLLIASLSWNLLQMRPRSAETGLAEEVLSDHIRSLLGGHLTEVVSTDQHTVKPWFAGKLDFSPAVEDLSTQGFPLAGGRVEYLDHRRVAALVYYRRRHVIDLFTWPGESSSPAAAVSRDGYHLLHWTGQGMTYWAVSDVSAADLDEFRSLLR